MTVPDAKVGEEAKKKSEKKRKSWTSEEGRTFFLILQRTIVGYISANKMHKILDYAIQLQFFLIFCMECPLINMKLINNAFDHFTFEKYTLSCFFISYLIFLLLSFLVQFLLLINRTFFSKVFTLNFGSSQPTQTIFHLKEIC